MLRILKNLNHFSVRPTDYENSRMQYPFHPCDCNCVLRLPFWTDFEWSGSPMIIEYYPKDLFKVDFFRLCYDRPLLNGPLWKTF